MLLESVVEIRFGRVVTCATNLSVEPLANRPSGLGVSEKSGLGTGLNLGDQNSTQSQAGRGFTYNPVGHFCRLFKCTPRYTQRFQAHQIQITMMTTLSRMFFNN